MAVVCRMCGQNAAYKCLDCSVPLCSKECMSLKKECTIGDGLMYDARLEVYKYLDPPEILNLEQTNKGLDQDDQWFDEEIWDYHLYTHYPSIYNYVKDRERLQSREAKRTLSINLYRMIKKSADVIFDRRFRGNFAPVYQRIADLVFAQYPDGDPTNLNYRVFIAAKIIRGVKLANLLIKPYGDGRAWTPMAETKVLQYLQNNLNIPALIEEYTAIQLERNPVLLRYTQNANNPVLDRNTQTRYTDWVRENMKMIVTSAIDHIFAIDDRTLLISMTTSPFENNVRLSSLQYQVGIIALGSTPEYLDFLHHRYLASEQLIEEFSQPLEQIDVDKIMRIFVMLDAQILFTEAFALTLEILFGAFTFMFHRVLNHREELINHYTGVLYTNFPSLRPIGNPDMLHILDPDRDESGKIILGRIDYKQ